MKKLCSFLLLAVCNLCAAQDIIVQEPNVENAYPRLSKDGKSILYQSNRTGSWQLYTCDLKGNNRKRITNDTFNNNLPDWSADNKWIAFVSDRDGNEEVYIMHTDGTHLRRLTNDPARDIHPYFSPDGKYLLFNSDRAGQFDVYRYRLTDDKTMRLTGTSDNETCARYAPDMNSIVLLKNNNISDAVCLLHLDNFLADDISRTPKVFHGWPAFSNDGKWVYYSSMEGGTYSIYRVHTDGTCKEQLTHAPTGKEHDRVSVSPDGTYMIYNIKQGNMILIAGQRLR